MQKCCELELHFVVPGGHRKDLCETPHSKIFLSREEKVRLFESYPYFLGFNCYEPNARLFAYDNVTEDLELADRYRGYGILQARGMADLIQEMAYVQPAFLDKLTQHKERVIHMTRQTTVGRPTAGVSDVLGAWQIGMADHLGFEGQAFMWAMGGLTTLFGEETSTRCQNWPSVFTYPEAIVGMEWLEAEHNAAHRLQPHGLLPAA